MSCGNRRLSSVVFNMSLVVILVMHMLVVASGDTSDSLNTDGSEYAATCKCGTESAKLTCSEEPKDCAEGEVLHSGSCYRFIRDDNDLKSRDDAHKNCIARNSHLVYIELEDEQNFLTDQTRGYGEDNAVDNNHYWIGLIPTSNNVWLDGTQANNSLFEFQGSAAGCYYIYKSNGNLLLSGENCHQPYQYICERSYICISGEYFNHQGSCYWIGDSTSSHLSAQEHCGQHNGDLLYIESQAELQFIGNSVLENDDRHWIGLTTQYYAWLDGSRAVYQEFAQNQYRNNHDSLCFKLHPNHGFKWNDFNCDTNYAYICEREIPVITSHQIEVNLGVSCRPPVAGLNRLLDSVPLCVRSDSHYFNNAVLCRCDDNETCINGCGCARDTMAGLETIRCSCGSCSFTFDEFEDEDNSRIWPSNFTCSCIVNGTSSKVTVVNGESTCVPDDSESLTTPAVTSEGVGQRSTEGGATGKPVTTDKPMTTGETAGGGDPAGQTGVSIGIPVGVTLSLLFILVVLVVGVIWWKRREKGKRIDKPLTTNTQVVGTDTINVNPTYELDEDDPVTENILNSVAAGGPSVLRLNPPNVYADVKPNEQSVIAVGTSEAGSYATIESVGYTSYKPKGQKDVYTALQGTKDSNKDSIAAFKPKRGNDSPSATVLNHQDGKPTADDEGDYSLAGAPGGNDYNTFNRTGGKRPSTNGPTNGGLYNIAADPEDNEYNTFDRPGDRHPSNNAPTDEGLYNLTSSPESNAYDTFNRAGGKHPSANAPTDDGLYSVTNPPGDEEYNTFDRTGNRGPSTNAPTDEGVYSLTGPPEGDVYSTTTRVGRKPMPRVSATTSESEYSTLD